MSIKEKKTADSVMKSAGILVFTTLISSLLGYARNIIIPALFGKGIESDAYFAAFTIPDYVYTLLVGGALSAAFIPVFSSYLAKNEDKEGHRMASTIITLVSLIAAALCAAGIIFTPELVRLLVKFEEEAFDLTVMLTRIMFGQCFFMCLTGLSQGILQSYKRFTPPAIGGICYNLCIIFGGVLISQVLGLGIAGFSLAVVLGAVVNLFIQVPFVIRQGFKFKPVLDMKHEGVKKFFRLLVPVLIGQSVMEINLIVNQRFASGLEEGTVTLMKQAQTVIQLPIRIFAMQIALSVFPTLTGFFANEKKKEFVDTFSGCLRTVLFIIIPIAAGMISLRVPLIRVMYKTGKFGEEDVQALAYLLMIYTIGITAYSVREVMIRGFYATKNTDTPVAINIFIMLLNSLLSFLLVKPLGVTGLALAYVIAGFTSMTLLTVFFRRSVGSIQGRRILQSLFKTGISAAVMSLVLMALTPLFEGIFRDGSKVAQLIELMILFIAGVSVYFVMAYLLKTPELTDFVAFIKKKFLKRS